MTPDRSHYRKTSPTTTIDVYRVLQLFEVHDPCLQHAVKKLLAAGKRGSKDAAKDVAEAIESLQRWQEMRAEDAHGDPSTPWISEWQSALAVAEAALADIGDADREPGDDVAWCEARAAKALPIVREALRGRTG